MVGGCCLNLITSCIRGQSDIYRKHKRQQSKYTHRMELHQSWCIQPKGSSCYHPTLSLFKICKYATGQVGFADAADQPITQLGTEEIIT